MHSLRITVVELGYRSVCQLYQIVHNPNEIVLSDPRAVRTATNHCSASELIRICFSCIVVPGCGSCINSMLRTFHDDLNLRRKTQSYNHKG
jgi:hypothetical protein